MQVSYCVSEKGVVNPLACMNLVKASKSLKFASDAAELHEKDMVLAPQQLRAEVPSASSLSRAVGMSMT